MGESKDGEQTPEDTPTNPWIYDVSKQNPLPAQSTPQHDYNYQQPGYGSANPYQPSVPPSPPAMRAATHIRWSLIFGITLIVLAIICLVAIVFIASTIK